MDQKTREYPNQPRVACCGIVYRDGKILMVKRGNPPAKNKWTPPGGNVLLGETVFEATAREVFEETGIIIDPIRCLAHVDAIYRDPDSLVRYHYVILYIEGRYLGGEARPGDDAIDSGWFTLKELEKMEVEKNTLRILKTLLI